ncbi:MAG: radical SAM protein [Anaerolineales bacterium]|nr:radical SAM protein [Anaerolineales bacterium]
MHLLHRHLRCGASHSRQLADVVTEVQALAAAGVKEAVLTGVHLGSYGRDLPGAANSDLKHLVAAILQETEIQRLRLSSLEPWELAGGFFDLWARWPERLCPHLHMPLQAGTDRQLRAMARRCTVSSFRSLVEEARIAIPNLIVTTDLIAGFPGESEADFEEGLAFVETLRFAHAHVFPFSARTGTAAAGYSGHVPVEVKRERVRRLQAVVEKTGNTERSRFVGATLPVLWEGQGRELADQSGRLWAGLTGNYLRVLAVAPAEWELRNQITECSIAAVEGEALIGVLPELQLTRR